MSAETIVRNTAQKNKSTKTQQNNAKEETFSKPFNYAILGTRLIHTLYRLSSSLAFTAMDIVPLVTNQSVVRLLNNCTNV